ncbi:MAG: PBP1A family penicillin-binding protein [Marinospirillum sp.]|uniref:penicillin-binding protein 1A n=1 Tax=Marinospirillum sp. TaxID=2183934 RepID=UPI0019E1E3A7|nr:PBP1A family penicillin-binding protein [Marinospirillum sp.]MBE0506325.1 PBP1A family penicillin-binding protein [Marinospirillum sp.]
MKLLLSTFKYLIWLVLAAAGIGGVWAMAVMLYFWPGLHDEVAQLQDVELLLSEQLEMPMRIYTADSRLIAEFGEHRRTRINYEDIPRRYIDALLAAEDASFYDHPGVDVRGLARATVQLLDSGQIQSGGSTITMQVARNYLLTRDRTFARKIREILLSLRMEQLLTKQQILELYVNKIYLGHRAYGIVAASEVYYGKPLHELNLSQIAMIAGLPKAPSAYNPLTNPRRALIRRNWILSRMYNLGQLDDMSYEGAIRAPVSARFHPPERDIDAPYVAESARLFALEQFGDQAYTRGLKVYTSIHSEQQLAANLAINQGLLNYDQRRGWRGAEVQGIPLVEQMQELEADALAEIQASESGLEQVQQALVDPRAEGLKDRLAMDVSYWLRVLDQTPVYGGLQPAIVVESEAERLLLLRRGGGLVELTPEAWAWAGRYHSPFWKDRNALPGHRLVARGDLVRLRRYEDSADTPWMLAQLPGLEAALVAMKTETGEITAMVGGFDYNQSRFNRAEQALRQAGSVFKPFIYMAALERGYTPATIINDAPVVFEDQQLEDVWRPQNSSGTFYGPTRLREGLYKSRNLISIRVLNYVGLGRAIEYVSRFGFDRARMPRDLSLSLGSANVTPLEMTQAYAMLANGGYRVEPYLVTRIEDGDGELIYQAIKPRVCRGCPEDQENMALSGVDYPLAKRLVDPRAVYSMHSILRDVIDDGTGRRAQALDRSDIRGKTGTTNELHDAWFSGFNRDTVASVWAGFDQPASTGEYGANLALPMWINFMKVALQNQPERVLDRPEGLVTVRIDPDTGLRARPGQQDAMFEIFYQERVPEELSSSTGRDESLDAGRDSDTSRPSLIPAPEALF